MTNLIILGGGGVGAIITGICVFLNRRKNQVTEKEFEIIQQEIAQRDRNRLETIKEEITRIEGEEKPVKGKKDIKFRRRR